MIIELMRINVLMMNQLISKHQMRNNQKENLRQMMNLRKQTMTAEYIEYWTDLTLACSIEDRSKIPNVLFLKKT